MARVVGSVVSSQEDSSLVGRKLMIDQPVSSDERTVHHKEVAADTVGAGVGEYVLLVRGAGARRASAEAVSNDVNDCSIVGIIDRFDK